MQEPFSAQTSRGVGLSETNRAGGDCRELGEKAGGVVGITTTKEERMKLKRILNVHDDVFFPWESMHRNGSNQ
jgi:hypothetical protein